MVEFPPLHGRHVHLRTITPDDYRFLQLVETSSELGPRWRFRGSTPSPEQWAQTTWGATLAQFIVAANGDQTPIGLVAAYQPNFQDGHAYLGAARFELRRRSPALIFGLALFLQYVFACWDLRKLYMELPEYNFAQFASGLGRLFEIEGRLREHTFSAGRHWDQLLLALYRDAWLEHGRKLWETERRPA